MYQEPLLADYLKRQCDQRVGGTVGVLAATCNQDEELIGPVVERLEAPRIMLGERFYERETWKRTMTATSPDSALLRRGIRPGQKYTHEYAVYRVDLVSGAEYGTCGANGGPMVDPTFMYVDSGHLVLRAASDEHRDEPLRELDEHIERANRVIDEWNSTPLGPARASGISSVPIRRCHG